MIIAMHYITEQAYFRSVFNIVGHVGSPRKIQYNRLTIGKPVSRLWLISSLWCDVTDPLVRCGEVFTDNAWQLWPAHHSQWEMEVRPLITAKSLKCSNLNLTSMQFCTSANYISIRSVVASPHIDEILRFNGEWQWRTSLRPLIRHC